MARSVCTLTACEPVGELTWGELTLACSQPRDTDGQCALGRPAGLPWAEGTLARTRQGQGTCSSGRTPGSSPDFQRVRRSSGSSNGSRLTQPQKASSSAGGRVWGSLAEELVALASRNSPASAAGGGHASRWRRRPSKGQQGATQLQSQSIA
jgi:hypothetical protein